MLNNVLTLQNILSYLGCINIIGFFAMWIDKVKAKHNSWRIKERTLFGITLLRRRNRMHLWYVYI